MSYKIPQGIRLVVWRVFERLWGFLESLGGSRRFKGGKGGSARPLYGPICPSGNLVGDQIGFQTPHNSTNGQSLQGRHHWYIFGALGPLKGLLKCHYTANKAHLEP